MNFEATYAGASGIVNGVRDSTVALAANTLREATFLEGGIRLPLLLREGLAALYDVVVSDFKYRPKDRVAFFAWLAEQDRKFLANLGVRSQQARQQIEQVEARLFELDSLREKRRAGFYRARDRYFEYVYKNEYELAYLLDPVITVHPDEVSFEAFSKDESSYGRLAVSYEMFERVDQFECGTTNIDFSPRLHDELDRMRSYRRTRFAVNPSGLSVATGKEVYKEKKIDLPDSWLMGFLQVHSTMNLSLTRLRLAPVDLFNMIRYLRRRRAKTSPRSMRFELVPGRKPFVVLEPWNHQIELTGAEVHEGKPQTVRTWGRDRLRVLTRLLPAARSIDVYLAGLGLPTIYVADLGPMKFTLALSGWTDNDWTGGAKFDLLTRRLTVTPDELSRTYASLRETRHLTAGELAQRTALGVEKARSAAAYLCQVGRAMFDLGGGVYRHRDLFATPFSVADAIKLTDRAAEESNERAKMARLIFEADNVRIIARRPVKDGFKLSGSAKGADDKRVRPLVHVDRQGQIISAVCTCSFARSHQLTAGPCEHILALRLAHMAKLESEDASTKGGGE
jgi:hypothetical protein